MGRITHLYVKEGEHVKKGEIVATIEHVQQEASVDGQKPPSPPPKPTSPPTSPRRKTAEANVDHAKADLEQKKLDWDRAQALYKDGIMAKQDFDAKKAAYDLDVASVAQAVASSTRPRPRPTPPAATCGTASRHASRRPEHARPHQRRRAL